MSPIRIQSGCGFIEKTWIVSFRNLSKVRMVSFFFYASLPKEHGFAKMGKNGDAKVLLSSKNQSLVRGKKRKCSGEHKNAKV